MQRRSEHGHHDGPQPPKGARLCLELLHTLNQTLRGAKVFAGLPRCNGIIAEITWSGDKAKSAPQPPTTSIRNAVCGGRAGCSPPVGRLWVRCTSKVGAAATGEPEEGYAARQARGVVSAHQNFRFLHILFPALCTVEEAALSEQLLDGLNPGRVGISRLHSGAAIVFVHGGCPPFSFDWLESCFLLIRLHNRGGGTPNQQRVWLRITHDMHLFALRCPSSAGSEEKYSTAVN
jgi:hypothetical protein